MSATRFGLYTVLLFVTATGPVAALDLFSGFFAKDIVKSTIWEINEQYVRLVQIEAKANPNEHPVALDALEIQDALSSLQLWVDGGLLRDEKAVEVYKRAQATRLATHLAEALGKAAPDEDVTFNLRGYTDVMLSMVRRREWTTGRAFYSDGKLNLIIGEHRKLIDKAKKNVEGAFGVVDDFRDVHFQVGSRHHKGKMQGRVVTTDGVEMGGAAGARHDWLKIDMKKAAVAYREALVPTAVRQQAKKAEVAAAKLTLERRQMREEMARMRKELKDMQASATGSSADAVSLEDRLARLQSLKSKGLISEEDYTIRKGEILGEL